MSKSSLHVCFGMSRSSLHVSHLDVRTDATAKMFMIPLQRLFWVLEDLGSVLVVDIGISHIT